MNKNYLFVAAVAMCAACQSDHEDSEGVSNGSMHKVYLTANAVIGGGDLVYPITVYAYDSNNAVAAQQTINSPEDGISMRLKTGQYTISTVSGSTDFSKGYTTTPLMMGTKQISLTSDIAEDIAMQYKVASVNVVLTDVRPEATSVSISLAPLYGSINNKGELSGSVEPMLECTKSADGTWTTGTFYVLPSINTTPVLTIKQTLSSGKTELSHKTIKQIVAGTPYLYKAQYDKNSTHYILTLTISGATWGEGATETFVFGEDDSSIDTPVTPGTPDTPDTPVTPSSIKAGTIWNGHIVALVNGNTATLLSKKEWDLADVDVLPTDEIAAYSEDGMTGWTLPTEEQGKTIAETYHRVDDNPNYANLNSVLEANGLTKIQDSKDDIKYLCGDGTTAYSYINFSRLVGTSDKTRDYRIRLIKTVTVSE
ncbi:MAG: hypothetical protein Q4E63_04515 [Prevotellaceae bacterium]|nr:hypothetical protein [Prevotellaceae bacterium]MDO4931900.1 hypothetical protein [Prevotellaceae bacterium]